MLRARNKFKIMLRCGEHCKSKCVLLKALERLTALADLPLLEGVMINIIRSLLDVFQCFSRNNAVNILNLFSVVKRLGVDVCSGGDVIGEGEVDLLNGFFEHSLKLGGIVLIKLAIRCLDAL